MVRGAGGVLNNDGLGNNNQVEHIAEQKSKAVLLEMYGKDFSEYGFVMPVLRRRCNYGMRTRTEVMKGEFGFDKSERVLPLIVVQASIFKIKLKI